MALKPQLKRMPEHSRPLRQRQLLGDYGTLWAGCPHRVIWWLRVKTSQRRFLGPQKRRQQPMFEMNYGPPGQVLTEANEGNEELAGSLLPSLPSVTSEEFTA